MLGVAGEEIQRVGEKRKHGAQRIFGPAWTSREVEDERAARDATHSAAEGGERSMELPFLTYQFSEARDKAVANGEGRLRRNVTRCQSCAPGGDDELYRTGSGIKKCGR
jgi:hypothetical protein